MQNNNTGRYIGYLYRKFQKYINKELKEYGINSAEFGHLVVLYENGNTISQDEICKIISIDRAAVTRAVKSLEEKGFVIKSPCKKNTRHNEITLTKKALDLKNIVWEKFGNYNKSLQSVLEEDELKTTLLALEKLAKRAKEMEKELNNE